ncbi:MAG TPA: serine/threonine-protein kinase [Kofleriaceae bacterium]|nr:serine/threonine-protein kinase [Kofleriaceae bacterium]
METAAGSRQVPPGTMLDDKYRVEHLLAMGGMGAVYLGTHIKLRKRVAIKVLNPQLSSKAMVERFHREAITASQIGHEGIAQVTDLGTSAEGEPFLVMEYLEGESLGARLEANGPLPIDLACELGCSILAPLAAAHQAGIVHRDLKPDNVFLVRRSRGEGVKLLDFGISRAVGGDSEFRLTKTGLVLGTPYYMSPEQARGESEITPAADLYAFGVILYEMIVGRVPIEGENYNQLMYRVLTGEFERPRAVKPEIPEALEQIILQAMAPDPKDRPASALELEQQLHAFCRPSFRQIERVSSSGFRPLSTPAAGVRVTGRGMTADDLLVPSRPRSAPDLEAPAIAAAQTMLAAPSELDLAAATATATAATAATAAPRRSRARLAAAALAAVVGIAAVTAVIAGGRKHKPEPPAPAATTEHRPEPAPAPPARPAPPPPEAAKPPPPPVSAATVTLRFAVEPADAAISVDDVPVKDGRITVPQDGAPHRLRIAATGYITHEEKMRFEENQKVIVQLRRAGRPTGPQRARVEHKVERIESKSPYEQ